LAVANGGTAATTAAGARTSILPAYAGNAGKVLAVNPGATDVEYIAAGGTGTVTSVGGTGTVNGLSLSGTVTTSGNLTLGGTLDLSAPPAIGGTTPAAITGTTVTANTKFVSPNFDAASSAGGALRTSGGSNCLQWGGGGAVNLTLDGPFNMNPANASISIAPTGTGTATINPATAGTINNMAIGGTTPAAGAFTSVTASTAIGVASGGTGATSFAAAGLATLTGTEILTNKTVEAGTFTNGYTEEVATANTSTAYTIDLAGGSVQILTLTGNCTFTFPTATAGRSFFLLLKQDATGGRTVTWPAAVKWPGGTAPTITSTALRLDKFVFTADGTNFYGSVAGQNYTV
jgi:hypothetical protein